MNFNKYKIEKNNDGYTIIFYINKSDVEFSDKLGELNKDKKSSIYNDIVSNIKEKFPNLNITLCKVMVGSMIIASLPVLANTAHASNNVQSTSTTNYTVISGDTLWKIANRYSVSVNDIKSLNNLTNDTIYLNQVLKIPTKTVSDVIYAVKSGDSLWKIANTYNTTIDNIKKLNNLSSDNIYVGQKLVISKGTTNTSTYTVKSGDTLWELSKKFNMSVNDLKSINNLSSDNIYIGQVLKITGTTEAPSKPTITYITHTVKSGENAWTISLDYGIPMQELLNANGLNSNSVFSIGQALKIPVHNIPVKPTMGAQYGEYLDWWTEAQYVLPINKVFKVTDFKTGKSFMIKRTIGANHADCEPLTSSDSSIAKNVWGGYSWTTRPVLIEVDGRKIAASMSFMPHGVEYIPNNNFDGHFDIHFLNSTRHKDGQIDTYHQNNIKISAGITK